MREQVSSSALWRREFNEAIADLTDDGFCHQHVANNIRYVQAMRLLSIDDIKSDPKKFFLAHRMLAREVTRVGSGFWARFSLHYNLFGGTLMALASPHQVTEFLFRNEVKPCIGCFAMTEQLAGDKHGFSIQTTAELSPDEKSFVLHTPNDDAAKTWVGQGLTADQAIVIAKMVVHGHSYGPQAFLIDLRDHQGKVLQGITMLDMGKRDNGNDVDNARISFDRLRIPLSAHLCRYLQVKEGMVRHPLGRSTPRLMDVIGQRLFTARVLVAQAALAYTRAKLERASNAVDASRICFTPAAARISPNGKRLSKGFLSQAFETLDTLTDFCSKIEVELSEFLIQDAIPGEGLQQAIAVAKVEAVEASIDICSQLQGEPAYHRGRDFLHCCKCTEGESHFLMQKMARDLARVNGNGADWQVKAALNELKQRMIEMQMGASCTPVQAWDNCGDLVYTVAECHMNSVLSMYGCLTEANS